MCRAAENCRRIWYSNAITLLTSYGLECVPYVRVVKLKFIKKKMSGFLWSLTNGDLDQVKEFVENQGVDINASIDGRLPIHYAADYGQKEVLNYLIEKGANIDAKDKYGISALLAAIWEGHTSCVKLMLDKGASKVGQTPDGSSYFDAAEKPEIKELLKC